MTYLTDKLTEVLGGDSRLRGAEGFEYGHWTPQGIRRVAILPDGVFVEYHKPYNKGRVKGIPLDPNRIYTERESGIYQRSNQLAPLTMKKFMTLEEVIVDSNLNLDLKPFLSKVDPKSRLRIVSMVTLTVPGAQWIRHVKELSDLKDAENDRYNSLWTNLGPVAQKQSFPGPNAESFARYYTLTSRVYSSDRIGGPLEQFFKSVAEANGVTPTEAPIEKTYNPKQEANLLAHRQNVRADALNLPVYNQIAHARIALRKAKSNSGFDAPGVKQFLQALRKIEDKDGVKGLSFYLREFAEHDNVPQEVEVAYDRLHLTRDGETDASTARIDNADGYLPNEETLRRAMTASYKSRQKRNLYVPDQDLFKPGLATLEEWVTLLTGGDFPYIEYSKALQHSAAQGDSDLEHHLEEAKQSVKTDAARDAVDTLIKHSKDGTSEVADFLKAVQSGTVNAAKTTYLTHGRGIATQGSEAGYSAVKVGIRAGLAYIGKGRPWGVVVNKFSGPILNAADDKVLPLIYDMLAEIDTFAEGGERSDENTGALTPELESEYLNIFTHRYGGRDGVSAITGLYEYVSNRGGLRERQFERFAHSTSGAPGFKEFTEKHKELFTPTALDMFRKMDYFSLSEHDFDGVNTCPLMDPLNFLDSVARYSLTIKARIQGTDKADLDTIIEMGARPEAFKKYVSLIIKQWEMNRWTEKARKTPMPDIKSTEPSPRRAITTGRGIFGMG